MADGKLSPQLKKWVQDVLLNPAPSTKSIDILEREAVSLARNTDNKDQLQKAMWEGFRLLHYAARSGSGFLLRLLLDFFSLDVNLPDKNGTTLAHHVALTGDESLLKTLLTKYMCEVDAKDDGQSTPLCYAIGCGQNSSLDVLMKYGASIHVESYLGMPIHVAAYACNRGAMRKLYKASPDVVNAELYGFCTPLVVAASLVSDECFKYLVKVADINAKPLLYQIICFSASEDLSRKRIKLLLKRQVDPNRFDNSILCEELPIICAAKKGWRSVVEILLEPTTEIPGAVWSVDGLIEYVNKDEFKENNRVERQPQVDVLKKRLIQELRQTHYLAADLILKALRMDLEEEHWDWFNSMCTLLFSYWSTSQFMACSVENFQILGMNMLSEEPEAALQAFKACMALDPENGSCQEFYRDARLAVSQAIEARAAIEASAASQAKPARKAKSSRLRRRS